MHPANTGRDGELSQRGPASSWRPRPALGRPVDDAQERANAQADADLEPRVEVLPCPQVHPNLAALAAFAAADKDAAADRVQIALSETERFADSQPGSPEQHDQRSRSQTMRLIAGAAHYGDDLLHGRWVGGVLQSRVARWAAAMKAGHGRRPAPTTSGIEKQKSRHARKPPPPDPASVPRMESSSPGVGWARHPHCPGGVVVYGVVLVDRMAHSTVEQ